jgi:hypothetical protein
MRKNLVLHPFLFAMSFVMALYARNIAEVTFSDILMALAITLGGTLLFFLLAWLILRDLLKAGIIASAAAILFLSYGHARNVLLGRLPWSAAGLPWVWAGLFLCVTLAALRMRWNLRKITVILNVAAAAMVVVSVITIVPGAIRGSGSAASNGGTTVDLSFPEGVEPPDIYYIILDSYSSPKTLAEIYNYDDSTFTNFLTEKGFYVASNSHSNYGTTNLSLSSSLNLDYMDSLLGTLDPRSRDATAAHNLLRNNKVTSLLQSIGYTYVHVGSWWGPTRNNSHADLNVAGSSLSEFDLMLIQTSALGSLGFGKESYGAYIQKGFEQLGAMPRIDGPKFVFAHIICPHWPYVFDAAGKPIEAMDFWSRSLPENRRMWLDQISFVNAKVEALVDRLLSESSNPPIIILQGDHGMPFNSTWVDRDSPDVTAQYAQDATGILNAYYLPQGGAKALYESITPVNTFRAIFNSYFGTDLPLLEDRSYVTPILEYPYRVVDLTDKLR